MKTITPDMTVIIEGVPFDVISSPQWGVDCLFPVEGKGSLADVVERFGDDLDVVLSSASFYRKAGKDEI